MDRKALLEALQDDLKVTRNSLDMIAAQIAAEESAYWDDGVEPWLRKGQESVITSAANSVMCSHEKLMKAWFDSVN
tara:strand:+ start:4255 stop:4482 length:228 start_codon:yes stop_codon:yes gene_type:complete